MTAKIRTFFARSPDPYAGGDIDNANRIGAVLFGLQAVLIVALAPFSPPTDAIGAAGWFVAGLVVVGAVAVVSAMRDRRVKSWLALLLLSYAAVVALEVMQWLGGGVNAPYERIILLPVAFAAATQPPRRVAGFLAFVALAFATPYLYDGWSAPAVGASAASLVVYTGLAFAVCLLFMGIRAQRLAHARDEAEAREEARVDALTGLHNRRAFDEALTVEASRVSRFRVPLSVAMIDVVGFKEINDHWSPAEGDRCLRELARCLQATSRTPDLCFRWGGDEFAVILGGASAEDAKALGDRIRRSVSAACKRPDGAPVEIRFAVAELEEGQTHEEMVKTAGLALTAVKLEQADKRDWLRADEPAI